MDDSRHDQIPFQAASPPEVAANLPSGAPPLEEPPFVIEHLQNDLTPSGAFTPDAQVVVLRALRTSGLLAHLPDSEARSLLAMLTLLTANGRFKVTAAQVATALGIPEAQAQARLDRLCDFKWQGKPVAILHEPESGLNTVVLSPHVIASRAPLMPRDTSPPNEAPPALAGREAILAQSRGNYGRPRAEVEREIETLYRGRVGSPGSDTSTPSGRLAALGVSPAEVQLLMAEHSEEEITDQLDWLPYRGAKNPDRFVVAAIEGRYEPPARIRLERALVAEEAEESESGGPQPTPGLPVGETIDLTIPLDDSDDLPDLPDPSDE